MEMIKAQSLRYEYIKQIETDGGILEKKVLAIDDLDISIPRGQFVAVLGHNGSGKSTLARQINALSRPTGGTLWVNGWDTKSEEFIWDIRKSAGMVFQNPDNQLVATVVEEDIAFGPENTGTPSAEIRRRVDSALKAVGMQDYAKSSPAKLSGGQKQRIAIAGVLAMKPDCIVLDEPTAMLDPLGRRDVMDTIIRLNKDEGITIVLITHYMDEAALADMVYVMDDGRLVMQGGPRQVFSQAEILKGYGLDAPQATEVAHRLIDMGIPLQRDILTARELAEGICRIKGVKPAEAGSGAQEDATDRYALQREVDAGYDASPDFKGIQIKNLTHIYNEGTVFEKKAVKNINLSIRRGEFVGLIGHTGSGKSTLIQHLNAIIQPSSGEILIDGRNIYSDKTRLREIRQRVGLVFQYPEHQLFELTVYKDVAFGPRNMGLSEQDIDKRVREAPDISGVSEDLYDKSPFDLSGGQKRRVAIAGVIAMRPEVLILDEPTAGLDPRGRDEILNALKDMHQRLGITVILVSHSMEDIARTVERIIVMHKGVAALSGSPGEVFSRIGLLKKMGLAAPQISGCLNMLARAGFSINTGIYTTEEAVSEIYRLLGEDIKNA